MINPRTAGNLPPPLRVDCRDRDVRLASAQARPRRASGEGMKPGTLAGLKGHPKCVCDTHELKRSPLRFSCFLFQMNKPAFKSGLPLVGRQPEQ